MSSCSARRELRLAASDWRALHAARRGARWQVSNEGLSLRPKGAVALLHRKGESRPSPSTQHDSNDRWGAHALRPKGAEALLHQKGEPRPTLNRQGYSRRGLMHRMEGSHATEGSQRLCCTGRGAPSDAGKSKETRLMEGLSLRPKGAAALLHRRGESPLRLNARRGLTHRKKGSHYNRREPAALLHREWEHRPPPSA